MPPNLSIDPASRTPIYVQLCAQIRAAIGSGALSPGERMPTMRAVALEARIDLNTVQKSYSELEREGFLSTRGSRGTFVASVPPVPDPARGAAEMLALARQCVASARVAGLEPAELGRLIVELATTTSHRES